MFYFGCVEDVSDPLMVGRYRVRVVGIHNENSSELPTDSLPWATTILPTTSACVSGIGQNPGLVQGSWVLVIFTDEMRQYPVIIGAFNGIPNMDNSGPAKSDIPSLNLTTPAERVAGEEIGVYAPPPESDSTKYLGVLTKPEYDKWLAAIRMKESTNNYSVVNQLGYVGAYQFGCMALEDLGYIKKGTYAKFKTNKVLTDWKTREVANSSTGAMEPLDNPWTGKNGCIDETTFLSTNDIQDKVMLAYTQRNFKVLRDTKKLVTEKTDPKVLAGMLAISHNQGAGKVVPHLKGEISKDGNGTTTKFYYDLGYLSLTTTFSDNKQMKTLIETDVVPTPSLEIAKGEAPAQDAVVQYGFVDPGSKYPLADWEGEADTNRLVRNQKIENTIVEKREATRIKSIPIALSEKSWEEPSPQYNAQYPHNHVTATESGHVFEMDDTPNAERINLHHTAGTFLEIDALGNTTNKIVGHNVTIVERDNHVYIKGNGHITLDGAFTLKGSQAYIETSGFNVKADSVAFDAMDFNVSAVNFNVKSAKMTLGGVDTNIISTNLKIGGAMISVKADGIVGIDGAFVMLKCGVAQPPLGFKPSLPDTFTDDVRKNSGITRSESTQVALEDDPNVSLKNANETEAEEPVTTKAELEGFTSKQPTQVEAGEVNLALKGDIQLSPNYKLKDLLKDGDFPYSTGQHGKTAQQIIASMKFVAVNVLEPLRAKYGVNGFKINSGFRPAGSKVSHSAKISQHETGEAVDVSFTQFRPLPTAREEFFRIAGEISLGMVPYDQLLLEYANGGSVWIHISSKPTGNRGMVLTLNNHKTISQKLTLIG